MGTRKFMGRKQLINRLAVQVKSKKKAIKILQDRSDLKADGKTFTAKGSKRNKMTARERAIDRVAVKSGKPRSAYKFIAKTNSAVLK